MLTYEEVDVTRDILEFKFKLNSEEETGNINYDVLLLNWTSTEITLMLNFSNPLVVSKGNILDEAYIVVKNKDLFSSSITGKSVAS